MQCHQNSVENSALRTLPLYFSFRLSYLSSLSQARILERNLYVNYSVYVGMGTMIGQRLNLDLLDC